MGAIPCRCGNLAILPAATCEACKTNERADYYCALLRAMRDGKSDLTPDIHANEREAVGWVLSVADELQAELGAAREEIAKLRAAAQPGTPIPPGNYECDLNGNLWRLLPDGAARLRGSDER